MKTKTKKLWPLWGILSMGIVGIAMLYHSFSTEKTTLDIDNSLPPHISVGLPYIENTLPNNGLTYF